MMYRRRGYRMRRRRLPVYKAIDDLEISVNNKGAQEIIKGPAVFCGCVLNFTLTQGDTNQCGNGWITVAVVRYPGNTVKGVSALESFNSRDVIAFMTYHMRDLDSVGRVEYLCGSAPPLVLT